MFSHAWLLFLSFSAIIFLSYGIKTSERSFNCPSQEFTSARISTRKNSEWSENSIYQNRIIGGDLAVSLTDYIGIVAARNESGFYTFCSAVKIAPKLLLASAVCASSARVKYAFLNRTSFFTLEGEINITKKHCDPLYTSGLANQRKRHDLCIIELESSSPSTSKYMRVSINASLPSQGTYVRMAGYGAIHPDGSPTSEIRQVDVPVYPEDECQERYAEKSIGLDFEKQTCSGYPDRECGICLGDSGGPMFQYDDDGKPVVVGVNIFFDQVICTNDFPTIAIRTAQYISNFTEFGLRNGIELTSGVSELRFTPTPSASPSSLSPEKGKISINIGLIIGIVVGVAVVIIIVIIIILSLRRRQKSRNNYLEDYVKPDIPGEFPQEDSSPQYPPNSDLAESVPSNFPSQPNSQTSFPTEIQSQPKPFVEHDVNNTVDNIFVTHIRTTETIATGSVLNAKSPPHSFTSTSTDVPGTHGDV